MTLVRRVDFFKSFYKVNKFIDAAGIGRISRDIFGKEMSIGKAGKHFEEIRSDPGRRSFYAASLKWLEHAGQARQGGVAEVLSFCRDFLKGRPDLIYPTRFDFNEYHNALERSFPPVKESKRDCAIQKCLEDLGLGASIQSEDELFTALKNSSVGELSGRSLDALVRIIEKRGEGWRFPTRWTLLADALLDLPDFEKMPSGLKNIITAAVVEELRKRCNPNEFSWDYFGKFSKKLLRIGEKSQVGFIRELCFLGLRRRLMGALELADKPDNRAKRKPGEPTIVFLILPYEDGRIVFMAQPYVFEHELNHMERKCDDVCGLPFPKDRVPGEVITITGEEILDIQHEKKACFRGVLGTEESLGGEVLILQLPVDPDQFLTFGGGLEKRTYPELLTERFIGSVELLVQAGLSQKTKVILPKPIADELRIKGKALKKGSLAFEEILSGRSSPMIAIEQFLDMVRQLKIAAGM